MGSKDKDLLNNCTVVVVYGGTIKVYPKELSSSNTVTIQYNKRYDEAKPELITMTVSQCETLVKLMTERLEEIKSRR